VNESAIILFDGVCNLCNGSVQLVIKNDPKKKFRFAALQSDQGKAILKAYGLSESALSSIILIQEHNVYMRSTAALKVAGQLSGIIKLLYAFIIVPAFIRDAVYDGIAKNRYKWFGKKETCMIPTAELQSRFIQH
jgi:predicted DCC family thiol-disulfide oxidoreductase YuxK